MNKKLIKNVLISLIAVLVLVGAYIAVDKWQPEDEMPSVEENETIIAFDIDVDDITQIEIKSKTDTITINKNKDDYSILEYPHARLLKTNAAMPFRTVDTIVASTVIDQVTDYEQYGLGDASKSVNITYKDKTKRNLYIGNIDPTDTYYYVKNDTEEKVYVVNKYNISSLNYNIDDFRDKNYGEFNMSTLTKFELYENGKNIVSIRKYQESDSLQELLLDDIVMTYPYYEYASLDKLKNLLDGHTDITANTVVSDTGASKAPYSIGKYVIKIADENGEHTLKLGNTDDDGAVYAAYEGSDSVFKVDEYWKNIVVDFVPFNYLYKLIHVYNIDDIETVKYTSNKGVYELNINRDKKEAVYTINNVEYSEEAFRDAYAEVLQITFTSSSEQAIKGEKQGSVEFVLKDGKNEIINYYNADDRNYLVERGDGSRYLVLKKNFDVVYDNITSFLNK